MKFDVVLTLVHRRLSAFGRSQDPDIVLAGSALAEASGLREAAQTADEPRQAAACRALGWLYLYRHKVIPPGPDSSGELARAILLVMPLAHNQDAVPEPLHGVLGRTAFPESQASLGAGLLGDALRAPDPALLEAGIGLLTKAVHAMPGRHPERAAVTANLGVAHLVRYERTGVTADLDLSIEYDQRAVEATPVGAPELIGRLTNLGNAFRERFARGGEPADLEMAIQAGERALATANDDHPDRGAVLSNLANAYLQRYDLDGRISGLGRAIDLAEQGLAAIPAGDPHRPGQLSNLGAAHNERYERTGAPADLDRTIQLGEEAIGGSPEDHPNRAGWLSNLGNAYRERYSHRGNPADLERAIELTDQAVASTSEGTPSRAAILSCCGLTYQKRYEHGGALSDLERAIRLAERALAAAPERDANRTKYVANLSDVHVERYRRSGAISDLDRAIKLAEHAVAATPPGHPDLAGRLSGLGLAHRERFRRGGVLAELDRAVDLLEQSVAVTPESHTAHAARLSNLGLVRQERYVSTGDVADLDRAVDVGEQALAAVPEDHPERLGVLSSLGLTYQRRYGHGGAHADLDRAIRAGEQAAVGISADHPDRGAMWSDLGLAYFQRFERGEAPADLDLAIHAAETAVDVTPEDHPHRARYLSNLADACWFRLNLDERGLPQDTVLQLGRDVRTATSSSPTDRVTAGHIVGVLTHAMRDHRNAVEMLDTAVALLPSTAPREGEWPDRERGLGQHAGVVSEAIAAHCALGDPTGAVEVAELGRGILLGANLDSRTDLTDLEHAHPNLAENLRRLRDRLAVADSMHSLMTVDAIEHIDDRRRLWAEHDELLTEIRRQPGFTRFLLPPRLADLRFDGTVVLVNAGVLRSDAIIMSADTEPRQLALPRLYLADVRAKAEELLDATNNLSRLTGPLQRQRVIPEILSWLWETIVEPVLEAVGIDESKTRVWWLPTGLLGLFPLHAAGHPGQPGALDRVVSSYTPTLRALAHAHTRPAAVTRSQLTVALRHTPGLPELPGCVAEAAALQSHHPGTPPLADHNATAGLVRTALPQATWAHFACHAGADLTNPSQGGLQLNDGILPIPEISRLRLNHAELAYLSACSTAHSGSRLADESIHLASAFQLAGFRHVIATLWPLHDRIAAAAAHSFYELMPATASADRAAIALHRVTQRLRTAHPDRADLWAPLIHSGP
ncbi:CHAT domain-containing protein [Streptomyces sp. NPDC002156]